MDSLKLFVTDGGSSRILKFSFSENLAGLVGLRLKPNNLWAARTQGWFGDIRISFTGQVCVHMQGI